MKKFHIMNSSHLEAIFKFCSILQNGGNKYPTKFTRIIIFGGGRSLCAAESVKFSTNKNCLIDIILNTLVRVSPLKIFGCRPPLGILLSLPCNHITEVLLKSYFGWTVVLFF